MEGSMPGSSVLHYLLDFLRFMSIESVMLSNHLISCCLFSSFAFNLSHHQGLFQWVDPFYQIAKVLELQLQRQFFQLIVRVDFLYNWFLWPPCSPRESQEFSPMPQFKSIDSSACSLLYGPTLTSIHEYWKHYSFDHIDICLQSDISAFWYAVVMS